MGRLGWLDVKRRYRRTTIGPFWTSITLAIYVLTVGTVGAAIWHQNVYDYLPFLVSGMIVWTLVSSIITELCSLFIAGRRCSAISGSTIQFSPTRWSGETSSCSCITSPSISWLCWC